MKVISTKVHAMLDYIVGLLLIAAPWIFGFANGGPAQTIPIVLGIIALLMSVFTAYEGGLIKRIPMPVHLSIDLVSGIFLAVSPWLFGFSEIVFWPHLVVGLLEIGASLMTVRTPIAVPGHSRPGI